MHLQKFSMKNLILSLFLKNKPSGDYLSETLNKVSRSFAIVIPLLDKPLDKYISVAYLICRVADNIEDCHENSEWKNKRFIELKNIITGESDYERTLKKWSQYQWKGLNEDEVELMTYDGGHPNWALFHDFPIEIKLVLTKWIFEMIEGMMRVVNKVGSPDFSNYKSFNVLKSEQDYNKYCYFVAGTIGYLATELITIHYKLSKVESKVLQENSEASGRALQKTNIIKDFKEDIENGISFIPLSWHKEVDFSSLSLKGAHEEWKSKVLKDALDELEKAMNYVMDVPVHIAGYRAACLMSFLPAYETIYFAFKNIDNLFTNDHYVKISKLTFLQCHKQAQKFAKSNEAIKEHLSFLKKRFEKFDVNLSIAV